MENKRLQWNLDLMKGQGVDKILGLPKDGFLLNSLKTLFSTQSTFRFLEMHSKQHYKICICLVILGEPSKSFRIYMGFSIIFLEIM